LGVAVDRSQEFDPFLVTMALHALPDYHLAARHVERGEQRRCAVALVVVRHGSGPPLLQRQARLGAIQAWIWFFSSSESTSAVRRIEKRPTTSMTFSTNRFSFDSLNVLARCGLRPWALQILWHVRTAL
jgi:hypothetical protein